MDKQELLTLCKRRGYRTRLKRGEVMLQNCPFCTNPRWNCELNADKGVYHSWCCRESGRLEDFVEEFLGEDRRIPVRIEETGTKQRQRPDIIHKAGLVPAWEVASARNYLHSRHLTDQDIGLYNIYVATNEEHNFYGRIVFVLEEYWTTQEFGYLARSYTHRTPKYLTDIEQQEVARYIPADLRHRNVHVLVEGVFDAIRAAQAGFRGGAFLGKPSEATLQEWGAMADRGDQIVVMLDGDARRDAERATGILSTVHDHVTNHQLPKDQDPASLGAEELETRVIQEIQETR